MTAKIIPFPKRPPQPATSEQAAAALAAAIEASKKRHPSCTG